MAMAPSNERSESMMRALAIRVVMQCFLGSCSLADGNRRRPGADGFVDLADIGFRQVAEDEDDAAFALAGWPIRQFDRRVEEGLNTLDQDRPLAALDGDNAL